MVVIMSTTERLTKSEDDRKKVQSNLWSVRPVRRVTHFNYSKYCVTIEIRVFVHFGQEFICCKNSEHTQNMSVLQRLFDRVVKVIHSKCIGKLPRRFKSCSSRAYDFVFLLNNLRGRGFWESLVPFPVTYIYGTKSTSVVSNGNILGYGILTKYVISVKYQTSNILF